MNPNNCDTCKYKQMNEDPDLHCYMFKEVPTEVCLQHSSRTSTLSQLTASLENSTFAPMQLIETMPDVSEFDRRINETDEEYASRMDSLLGCTEVEELITAYAEELQAVEDYEWRTLTLPKILKWYRKKLNKRKKQARARTGRRS